MFNNNDKILIEDRLKFEGILCYGYGVLYKYPMLDTELSIIAKTIYSFLCSFAGTDGSAYPKTETILKCLNISKKAYYKHYNMLLEQGYIKVHQHCNNGAFSNNVYLIASKPAKFNLPQKDSKKKELYKKILKNGLISLGYGIVPKAVMIDGRLFAKSKGLYSYFCVFSAIGTVAFPEQKNILYHLNIGKKAYYKYYKQLIDYNYLIVEQRHVGGRASVNEYTLNNSPDTNNAIKNLKYQKKNTTKFLLDGQKDYTVENSQNSTFLLDGQKDYTVENSQNSTFLLDGQKDYTVENSQNSTFLLDGQKEDTQKEVKKQLKNYYKKI